MKEKLTRNISLKILAVILAVLMWLIITNVNDPVQTKIFNDVPVTIKNEELIKTENQSYDILEGETVDFKVAARRSIIQNLTASDFIVEADFAHLSSVNSVNITITPKRYKDDIEIVDRGDVQHMIISIEKLSSKQIKVNIVEKGEVAEGYYIGNKKASPVIIEVSGPESKVEKIKQVIVEANVEGASSKTIYRLLEPYALDEEGNVIDSSRLTFSQNRIEVEIQLYQIKEIPLKITATGRPADGYVMTGIEYQPKTIEIAAEDSKLKTINVLEVTRDITGATEDIEEFIELRDWLDGGVLLVGEDTTASLNIRIEKLETKEVSIWPNDIELKNKSDSLKVEYITKGPIKVYVQGPASEVESINRNNLKPFINLLGYSAGTYYLDIEADISKNIKLNDEPKVLLNLIPAT